MKKEIITLLWILFSFQTFGQRVMDSVFIKYNLSHTNIVNYKADTIFFPSSMRRNMIFGTTVWPSSSNQYTAYWDFGIRFDKAESSECIGQVEESDSINTGIQQMNATDSVWIIKTIISDNCCYSFLCDIKIVNSNTLELDYYGYGVNHCDCDCFFELTYTLRRKDLDKSKNIEYVRIFANNKTMKKINRP